MNNILKESTNKDRNDLILITGPSGSGKTTVALGLRIVLHTSFPGLIRHVSGDTFGQIFFPWDATTLELDHKYSCLETILNHLFNLESRSIIILDDLIRRQRDVSLIQNVCNTNGVKVHTFQLNAPLETLLERNNRREGWLKASPERVTTAHNLHSQVFFKGAEAIDALQDVDTIIRNISNKFTKLL